jgi:lipid A ethanolaminephosphotransferase
MKALTQSRGGSAVSSWLRSKSSLRIPCPSQITFAAVSSLIWVLLYNQYFWEQAISAMWHPAPSSVLFFVSLCLLTFTAHAVLLLLLPSRIFMQLAASSMFIIAAASSYFSTRYGAVFNQEMMRNVLQTDSAEVGGLLTADFLTHLLVLGVLPAVLVWRVALPEDGVVRKLKQRALFVAAAVAISGASLLASSASYAVFFREHKPIRYTLVPVAPVSSLIGLLSATQKHHSNEPVVNAVGPTIRTAALTSRPLVLFLVVGETARAADFSLGGYERATNPQLTRTVGVVYFNNVASCGTSTAISVPCIFSGVGRKKFDADDSARHTNLLDALSEAGFDIEWRDNNAGCKGVCERAHSVTYADSANTKLCPNSYCFDEVMLTDLGERLRTLTHDTVFVFHQIGSHGPAYSERYPREFEIFKPACHSNELHRCSSEEIRNAYDNSIAYTDHVLAKQIGLLQGASERIDSLLLYASDHGESLGENGVYLHGLPYSFAPAVQKQVPMLLWASAGYQQRVGLDPRCMQAQRQRPLTHDSIYHTILAAAEARNRAYDAQLDVLASCRHTVAADHG